jgi:hypothetical protein
VISLSYFLVMVFHNLVLKVHRPDGKAQEHFSYTLSDYCKCGMNLMTLLGLLTWLRGPLIEKDVGLPCPHSLSMSSSSSLL